MLWEETGRENRLKRYGNLYKDREPVYYKCNTNIRIAREHYADKEPKN